MPQSKERFSLVTVLLEQFFSAPPELDTDHGERALRRAVLEDAVLCFQKYSQMTRRAHRRLALSWATTQGRFVRACNAGNNTRTLDIFAVTIHG